MYTLQWFYEHGYGKSITQGQHIGILKYRTQIITYHRKNNKKKHQIQIIYLLNFNCKPKQFHSSLSQNSHDLNIIHCIIN